MNSLDARLRLLYAQLKAPQTTRGSDQDGLGIFEKITEIEKLKAPVCQSLIHRFTWTHPLALTSSCLLLAALLVLCPSILYVLQVTKARVGCTKNQLPTLVWILTVNKHSYTNTPPTPLVGLIHQNFDRWSHQRIHPCSHVGQTVDCAQYLHEHVCLRHCLSCML